MFKFLTHFFKVSYFPFLRRLSFFVILLVPHRKCCLFKENLEIQKELSFHFRGTLCGPFFVYLVVFLSERYQTLLKTSKHIRHLYLFHKQPKIRWIQSSEIFSILFIKHPNDQYFRLPDPNIHQRKLHFGQGISKGRFWILKKKTDPESQLWFRTTQRSKERDKELIEN